MREPGRLATLDRVLNPDEIESFERDGFVSVRHAFPPDVAAACAREIWAATGRDPDDASTWTDPVVRLWGLATPPFVEAANARALREAFDQLVGEGRWTARTSLGTIPVRFPSSEEPGDDGWHIEGSFVDEVGAMRADIGSRGRALLLLFLFSDVGQDDAPTRIRVGSHRDVPPHLLAYGAQGREWMDACRAVVDASAHRQVMLATGSPGDVYLCHPFLVHAAQPHHGTRPRLMAQPPLEHAAPFDVHPEDPAGAPPVVRAILTSL